MKTVGMLFLGLFLFINGIPLAVFAQGAPEVFVLPDAVAGQTYRADVQAVLRDTYYRKLESDARIAVYRWTAGQGELPPGLFIQPNGSIVGVPRVPRAEPYRFQLRVLDISSPRSEALALDFSMTISAPRVRLAHVNPPRLVETSDERAKLKSQIAATPDDQNKVSSRSEGIESTRNSATGRWTAQNIYTSMLRTNTAPDSSVTTDATPSAPPAPAATTVDCSGRCDAPPPPKGTKDFIIDAVTGTTSGESKFKRTDRARIIIKNKNPFLYEYRITIEDKAVEEPALGALEELFGSIGKGTFPAANTGDKNAAEAAMNARKSADVNPASCPIIKEVDNKNDALLTAEGNLSEKMGKWTDSFNAIDKRGDDLKKKLITAGAQCPALCSDANSLVELLRGYLTETNSSFDEFAKAVSQYEKDANGFSAIVNTLVDQNAACVQEIKSAHLEQLAEHHLDFAQKLSGELNKLKEGRKKFDTAAKSVEKAMTTANAFYEVREKGDFNEATDVKIKIERKDITVDKSEFASVVETKLNFGGGPRFTLGGGLVASLLERPEYERVPTVVNGQVVNIVGLKRTSSSRVLPLLMLHTRIADIRRGPIDGFHFSVGVTAKPNTEGTSAEFLFGPSISFAEGRMFFTAGGYMGKKQELQGGFTLGSQIPKDFGDDVPTAEHYVWKPGFAITYKIK